MLLVRWVYRMIFVADGNFKADHVWLRTSADEYWLLDGSGMMANRAEYLEFIKTAVERKTVQLSLRPPLNTSNFGTESPL